MIIETTRFGPVEVDPERVLTFPKGLLGFPDQTRYGVIESTVEPDKRFALLQSIDRPDLAFVVTDPRHFFPDYRLPAEGYWLELLGVAGEEEVGLLAVVNKVPTLDGWQLTANLLGPLAIRLETRVAVQLVIASKRWSVRTWLMELGEEARL